MGNEHIMPGESLCITSDPVNIFDAHYYTAYIGVL